MMMLIRDYLLEIPKKIKDKLKKKHSCAICGSRNKLEVHHIDAIPKEGKLRVLVLCRKCHRSIHYLMEYDYPLFRKLVEPFILKNAIEIEARRLIRKRRRQRKKIEDIDLASLFKKYLPNPTRN